MWKATFKISSSRLSALLHSIETTINRTRKVRGRDSQNYCRNCCTFISTERGEVCTALGRWISRTQLNLKIEDVTNLWQSVPVTGFSECKSYVMITVSPVLERQVSSNPSGCSVRFGCIKGEESEQRENFITVNI